VKPPSAAARDGTVLFWEKPDRSPAGGICNQKGGTFTADREGDAVPITNRTATAPTLLLKPDEAAKALAISSRKLWAMTNAGEIPCVRLGRAVRYDPEDLLAWIEQRKEGALCGGRA